MIKKLLFLLMITNCIIAIEAKDSLIYNADFQNGFEHWETKTPQYYSIVEGQSNKVASVTIPHSVREGWFVLSQKFEAKPGEVLEASVAFWQDGIKDGHGSGITIEYYNANGERIHYLTTRDPVGAKGKTRLHVRGRVPEGTAEAGLSLVINGSGTAYYDDIRLEKISVISNYDSAQARVKVTEKIACNDFLGFGFEDDGWFYNKVNAGLGVTEEDYKLRDSRIAWMEPDLVRMFFWHVDWNPSQDWESYDWQTDNMLSHYRTLDLYQKLGTEINLCNVEWGHKNAWPEPKVFAKSIGALFEYLIKVKGYDCIKYWTFSNEPDGEFNRACGDFEKYIQYHIEVKKEFVARGLDVKIIGSDDTNSAWFDRCVDTQKYDEVVDLYSTHYYVEQNEMDLTGLLFEERVNKLKTESQQKPFIIAEYGFSDERTIPPHINPLAEEYLYALYNQSLLIDGLNSGVASFSYWCIHEMHYIDSTRMKFGMWNYKDRDWSIRPVYHSMANFSRLTNKGDLVYKCESSQSDVKIAFVGDTLFWVNTSENPKEIVVDGYELKSVVVMNENNLKGDCECGDVLNEFHDNSFSSPAKSFGYAYGEKMPKVKLENLSFDDGIKNWNIGLGSKSFFSSAKVDARSVAKIDIPESTTPDWYCLTQDMDVRVGAIYELSADVKQQGLCGGRGIWVKIEYLNSDGNPIAQAFSRDPNGAKGWTRMVTRCQVPSGAVTGRAFLIANGNGSAYFDNVYFGGVKDPIENYESPSEVAIDVTGEVVCESLIGFGYEDDAWMYDKWNVEGGGVGDKDFALIEGRIKWMDPDYVRMFFWYPDWNPSNDWETFDWETSGMRSHYRTLDLYQSLGTKVNIAGVEWGHKNPWPQPKVLAKAVGELLEHLIKTKGYTCIQEWTLTNEPDGFFNDTAGDFELFVAYCREVKNEIDSRGLEVKIVGSDDATNFGWFSRSIEHDELYELCYSFSSHFYVGGDDRDAIVMSFADRINKLYSRGGKAKPFVIGEYGFSDHRTQPPMTNPIAREYAYAIYNHRFSIDALNYGVAGMNYWCLQEMYYPSAALGDASSLMHFGLWDYKTNDWKIRPVYHSVSSFTKQTNAGDKVVKCRTNDPKFVSASVVGDTLFWVNEAETPRLIKLNGFDALEVCVMTEGNISGDRESGEIIKTAGGKFIAPARSFGYVEGNQTSPLAQLAWMDGTLSTIYRAWYDKTYWYPRFLKLKNGELLCTSDSPVDGKIDVIIAKSSDNGATWSHLSTASFGEYNSANGQLLQLPNGDLLCVYRYVNEEIKEFFLKVSISKDNGATWTLLSEVLHNKEGLWEPYMIQLPSGEIQVYYANEGYNDADPAYPQVIEFMSSTDAGKSWHNPIIVSKWHDSRDGMPTPVVLKNGDIYVVIEANDHPYVFSVHAVRSSDGGKTWSSRKLLYRPNAKGKRAAAPGIIQLPNGNLCVSFQTDEDKDVTHELACDARVMISEDDGENWSEPTVPFNITDGFSLWNIVFLLDEDTVIIGSSVDSVDGPQALMLKKGRLRNAR